MTPTVINAILPLSTPSAIRTRRRAHRRQAAPFYADDPSLHESGLVRASAQKSLLLLQRPTEVHRLDKAGMRSDVEPVTNNVQIPQLEEIDKGFDKVAVPDA